MSHPVQDPVTDLLVPLPSEGEEWNPYTIHTHYFGALVPEAGVSIFIYIRYLPYFPAAQGGLFVYRGMHNVHPFDMEYIDWVQTMPWPRIEGSTITTTNGVRIEFLEPGRVARITYESRDGSVRLDTLQEAVSPLAVRGHVVPGEELHSAQRPGGSEQMMHATGTLELRGETFAINSFSGRDRSWRQIRPELQGGTPTPPICWTPISFGEELSFNQVGIEDPDSDPNWEGLYEVPDGAPLFHYAWVSRHGELRKIVEVRRSVSEEHPIFFTPMAQSIEATDEAGDRYRFEGQAVSYGAQPAWWNAGTNEAVFRWFDSEGRETHGVSQSLWYDHFHRAMRARRKAVVSA